MPELSGLCESYVPKSTASSVGPKTPGSSSDHPPSEYELKSPTSSHRPSVSSVRRHSTPASVHRSMSDSSVRSVKSTVSSSRVRDSSKDKRSSTPAGVLGSMDKNEEMVLIAVRVRPELVGKSSEAQDHGSVFLRSKEIRSQGIISLRSDKKMLNYGFDRVYEQGISNETLFNTFTYPCVEKLLNGVDVALFAYGGTGSGKSYTMGFERGGTVGQAQLVCRYLFDRLKAAQSTLHVYLNFVEIYGNSPSPGSDNANITDLLGPTIRTVKGHEPMTIISQLTHLRFTNAEDCISALHSANARRQIGEQGFNEKSSRSHAIVMLAVATPDWMPKEGFPNTRPLSRIYLVDLAGSEPAHLWRNSTSKTGMTRYNEAIVINQGLGSLKACMQVLTRRSGAVASKNTAMLSKYLGDVLDPEKAVFLRIIACVTPIASEPHTIQLSRGTLDYAKAIKQIKLEPAVEMDLILLQKREDDDRRRALKREKSPKPARARSKDESTVASAPQPSHKSPKSSKVASPKSANYAPGESNEPDSQGRRLRPEFSFANGAKYVGQWKGSLRDGRGTMRWSDGAFYEGDFCQDYAHGQGTFHHANGDIFTGQLVEDQAQGYGEYYHTMGAVYQGNWLNDRKHGEGREQWNDNARYVGQFIKGFKGGQGKFVWSHGGVYEGSFHKNNMHGLGTYTWPDGRVYTGHWEKNKMHGEGTFKWPEKKKVYVGQFVNDQKHGYGRFSSADGKAYEGEWGNGRQHGKGFTEVENCPRKWGLWEKGKPVTRLKNPE